ncbi:MAG: hypothetical protein EBZ91_08615 [Gammaproteobacteria bacterium]|nr:hypothetical protein [Gammaproteobacteria bacterium]
MPQRSRRRGSVRGSSDCRSGTPECSRIASRNSSGVITPPLRPEVRVMMNRAWPRWLKIFLGAAVGLAVIAVGYFIWLVFLGGIAISDRAMLWKMLREEGGETPSAEQVARQLRVPDGFRIGVWAADLPSARLMAATATGDVLLTQPRGGRLLLLRADRDGDGRSDGRVVLREGLDRPNGIDLHEGWLYLAEASRVVRVRFDATAGRLEGEWQPIITGLTADGNHWRKSLRVGSDGKLYLGQGSTCNVCVEPDPRRATVMRFNLDGSAGEIIATGTRNPYGLDWAPWDGVMYATENGRDLIGDDIPPDELNRIEPGRFYGWPYVHGRAIVDPEFGPGNAARIAAATPPAHEFRAHNAPWLRRGGARLGCGRPHSRATVRAGVSRRVRADRAACRCARSRRWFDLRLRRLRGSDLSHHSLDAATVAPGDMTRGPLQRLAA